MSTFFQIVPIHATVCCLDDDSDTVGKILGLSVVQMTRNTDKFEDMIKDVSVKLFVQYFFVLVYNNNFEAHLKHIMLTGTMNLFCFENSWINLEFYWNWNRRVDAMPCNSKKVCLFWNYTAFYLPLLIRNISFHLVKAS